MYEGFENVQTVARGLHGLIGGTLGRETLCPMGSLCSQLAKNLEEQPAMSALAHTLAQSFIKMHEGQLDPAQALLLMASGVESLEKALTSLQKQEVVHVLSLESARFELETLFPLPGQEYAHWGQDVPVGRLRR